MGSLTTELATVVYFYDEFVTAVVLLILEFLLISSDILL